MSSLPAAIEAILFSSNRPLTLRELQQATDSDKTAVERALELTAPVQVMSPTVR